MNSKRKIIILISVGISFLLGWYILVKESDYTVIFKVKAATGTIFQGIEEWTNNQQKNKNGNYIVIEKKNYDYVIHLFKFKKMMLTYKWEIKSINDSMTQVVVGIKDAQH